MNPYQRATITIRSLLAVVAVTTLVACADPPGLRKPLPVDYNEQQRASGTYERTATRLNAMQGVLGSYLTSTNNPRKIVVVVKDNDAQVEVERALGTSIEGIPLEFKVPLKIVEDDGPIKPVETVNLPTTWWGHVVAYLKRLPERFMHPPPEAPAPTKAP